MADKRKTIDLDTWHEVCRRRDAGQPLDIPAVPLERRPRKVDTPLAFIGRALGRQMDCQLQMLPYAAGLLLLLGLILAVMFVLLP